jgi:hypothetical protein
MTEDKSETQQSELKRDKEGKFAGGKPPAGFDKHPENRNPGGWNKEGSISYQYNRLMRMTSQELDDYVPETVAQEIALNRLKEAKKSLNDVKEITDRTEGKAPQNIDLTSGGETIAPILVKFIGEDED